MKILFCGDVIGRSGRDAISAHIPKLREKLKLDAVIVNAENAAHGFGITAKIGKEMYDKGVDVITTGNHIWDQTEMLAYIDKDNRMIRPANYPKKTPGRGHCIFETVNGKKVLVIQVMGRLFMDPLDDPFAAAEEILLSYNLGRTVDAIVIDFHGEATSEKMAFGQFMNGKVSLVAGTHSHVPTADLQIFPKGTAYMTDVGMCGDYDSVIGMKKEESVHRFVRKIRKDRFSPANGEATLCAVYVETDDRTGLAVRSEMIRIGGRLSQSYPF
ncbi:MAG: TIGR00282 family metallophosphoesterase [Alphaproteobacteria bacterium]|nr:TIGR00282 family metallophosphoesterase [Alphaproteobacteria bacterium]